MRTLAFDGRTGASGDMLLGALVAAGADYDVLAPVEDALGLSYSIGEVAKSGITATSVDVLLDEENSHEGNVHTHAEEHGPHRSYTEVVGIVEGMGLPANVEEGALAVFGLLGEAEAAVHGTDLLETQFHEVGADDAIADVVGAALLLADLDLDRVVTTPLSTGGGTVGTSHGTYPVPTPAVVEIAGRADWSLRGGPVDRELLTPTGAAVLAHYATGVDSLPSIRISDSGYGAGGYDLAEIPNVLRAMVGETEGRLRRDPITVLETNVDDATPEQLGGLQETLTAAGARDVTVLPATMKKSRPGHLVKVVVRPDEADRIARRLAEETGTLGVREHGAGHRWIADRKRVTATVEVDDERHAVAVKVASDAEGEVFDVSAEYDDAAAVAAETGLAVREVLRRAEAAVRDGRADRLVHVVDAERWASFEDADAYTHPSLDTQGFIHCSTPSQAVVVAQSNYADVEDPLLLVIDPGRVDAEIRYEEQPGGGYAHVYGPLNTDAIVDVLAFPREGGRFVLPERLRT